MADDTTRRYFHVSAGVVAFVALTQGAIYLHAAARSRTVLSGRCGDPCAMLPTWASVEFVPLVWLVTIAGILTLVVWGVLGRSARAVVQLLITGCLAAPAYAVSEFGHEGLRDISELDHMSAHWLGAGVLCLSSSCLVLFAAHEALSRVRLDEPDQCSPVIQAS